MSKFDLVYLYSDKEDEVDFSSREMLTYLKINNIHKPKQISDVCDKSISAHKRKGFKEVQFYLDRKRIKRLVISSLQVIDSNPKIIFAFVRFVNDCGTQLFVMDKQHQRIVDFYIKKSAQANESV